MTTLSSKAACGPTVLRIVVGIVFLAHGWQKIHMGASGVAGFLGHLGIPLPQIAAIGLIAVEFLGGIALILGAATRWIALLLAVDMAVAILTVHLKNGFFAPGGYEFVLTLLAANVCLALTGGGSFSVDSALRKG